MKIKHLHALVAIMAVFVLVGCHSEIDLTNIDTTAKVEGGLALPIGTIKASLGDFLGNGEVEKIYVDGDGVFYFQDTVQIPPKTYHKIQLENYTLKEDATLKFAIKDRIGTGTIHGDGHTVTPLEFDLVLGMEGINEHPEDERIDSIRVSKARFTSKINVEDFGLNWNEIQSVQLILQNQFRPWDGNKTIEITGLSEKNFGQEVPIEVKNFTLSLLKDDKNPDAGHVNQINFKIRFNVCPGVGRNIPVTENSKFAYNLQVKVIDYDAIWGFFKAGNEMRDEQTINMDSLWDEWKNVKKLKVRFADPSIKVVLTHKIAAPLRMYIDALEVMDSVGNRITGASWGDDSIPSTNFSLPRWLAPDTDLKQSISVDKVFDKDYGHLDKLFDARPDYFHYKFHLDVDATPEKPYTYNQHRITRDSTITGYAVAKVPFAFNEGSEIGYASTIKDVNLSSFSLDSLIESTKVVNVDTIRASDIKLILDVHNSIPFDLRGQFTFRDKDSTDMQMVLVQGNDSNIFHFPAPTKMEKSAKTDYYYVAEPSVTRLIVSVEKNDFDRLSEIKYINFDAAITGNPKPCQLDTNTCVQVSIGVSALVDADLKFGSNEENKK